MRTKSAWMRLYVQYVRDNHDLFSESELSRHNRLDMAYTNQTYIIHSEGASSSISLCNLKNRAYHYSHSMASTQCWNFSSISSKSASGTTSLHMAKRLIRETPGVRDRRRAARSKSLHTVSFFVQSPIINKSSSLGHTSIPSCWIKDKILKSVPQFYMNMKIIVRADTRLSTEMVSHILIFSGQGKSRPTHLSLPPLQKSQKRGFR